MNNETYTLKSWIEYQGTINQGHYSTGVKMNDQLSKIDDKNEMIKQDIKDVSSNVRLLCYTQILEKKDTISETKLQGENKNTEQNRWNTLYDIMKKQNKIIQKLKKNVQSIERRMLNMQRNKQRKLKILPKDIANKIRKQEK